MKITGSDRDVLRDLAKRYIAICESDRNEQLKEEWRALNNMQPCRPMLHVNWFLLKGEIGPALSPRRVEDDLLAKHERALKLLVEWQAQIGDDTVFMPWFSTPAVMHTHPEGPWGVSLDRSHDEQSRGWRHRPVLRTSEDLKQLKATEHRVLDADPPEAKMLADIFGDILPVNVERSSAYTSWGSQHLGVPAGEHFGLEELLLALYTDPAMIHKFMAFTRDAVMANFQQGEAAGDWSTTDSIYYRTPTFCDDLPDPSPIGHGARLKDLAWFGHAQEFDAVSPQMFEEFLFEYQLPILQLFGRVTYGCCETLDTKLDVLKRLPNMTKILCGPLADPARYPDAYGKQCVISWRPLTSIIAAKHFDHEAQRRQLREGLTKLEGCNVELHMHEPMTVQGDLDRVRSWVQIAREEIESMHHLPTRP